MCLCPGQVVLKSCRAGMNQKMMQFLNFRASMSQASAPPWFLHQIHIRALQIIHQSTYTSKHSTYASKHTTYASKHTYTSEHSLIPPSLSRCRSPLVRARHARLFCPLRWAPFPSTTRRLGAPSSVSGLTHKLRSKSNFSRTQMTFVHDRSKNVPGGVTKKQNKISGKEVLEI